MAREINGWVKLYDSVLRKGFSHVEFHIWVGLLLLANSPKHNSPGLVDLPLREIATRLHVSVGALCKARDKFVAEERIEIVLLPGKTKPVMGIKIVNFELYQGKKFVSRNEHSKKKVPQNEQSNQESSPHDTKIVHPMTQKVSPSEQSVSPGEQSHEQNSLLQRNTKNTKEDGGRKQTFEEYKKTLRKGYPDLDFDNEIEKFELYWSEGNRKLKRPKLALKNWMDKAREIKQARSSSDGIGKKHPRAVKRHDQYKTPEEHARDGI